MLRKKVKRKTFPVKIFTLVGDTLQFDLELNATGQYLFNLVCSTFGIRETWYFGMQYVDSNGYSKCLKLHKKVQYQGVHEQKTMVFMFSPKFYPEDVDKELIQEISQHFFYLHTKCAIIGMEITCSPEDAVLLASYAVQAKLGDYDETIHTPRMLVGEQLLPQSAIDYYDMTADIWDERVKILYANHRGMSKDEAKMEYLKIAENLDMFGVEYFYITNKNNTDMWLGVTSLGLNIYEKENKESPEAIFQWSEIKNISYNDEKLIIKLVDKSSPNFVYFSSNVEINKLIIELCKGNHDLFMKRRRPDSPEIQQIKMQAKEEKSRRRTAHIKFLREKCLRENAEKEKGIIARELSETQEIYRLTNETLSDSISTVDHLVDNYIATQNKAMFLSENFSDDAYKAEQEKARLELRIWEAERFAVKMVKELEIQAPEISKLKAELHKARKAEKLAKEKLQYFLSSVSSLHSASYNHVQNLHAGLNISKKNSNSTLPSLLHFSPPKPVSNDFVDDNAIGQLTEEYDKERDKMLKKSKKLQNQVEELKAKIIMLKFDNTRCILDILHAEQEQKKENKFSSLKKVKSGSTTTHVTCYEEL